MSELKKLIPSITQGGARGSLTEEAVRQWLETFYALEVVKAEIVKRLTQRAAFWRA